MTKTPTPEPARVVDLKSDSLLGGPEFESVKTAASLRAELEVPYLVHRSNVARYFVGVACSGLPADEKVPDLPEIHKIIAETHSCEELMSELEPLIDSILGKAIALELLIRSGGRLGDAARSD